MHGDVVILGASSLARRRDQPQPGHRDARPRASPASCRSGRATPWAGRSSSGGAMGAFTRETEADLERGPEGAGQGRGAAAARPRPRRPRGREPARLPRGRARARRASCRRTGGSSSSASATSSATGGWSILTPFGGRVHAPWTMALEARLQERLGLEVQTIWSDDGIAIRLPEGERSLDGRRGAAVPGARGGRGPRRRAGRPVEPVRQPVPRERGPGPAPPAPPARHADPAVAAAPAGGRPAGRRRRGTAASRSSSRPIASASPTCSTSAPCARSSTASAAARSPSTASRRPRPRPSRARCCSTTSPQYMYEGDAPMAERRAQALTLDRDLLRELLGQEELRELLDPEALADLELSLQALVDERHANDPDQVHDLLRRLGDLSTDEVGATGRPAGGPRPRSTSPSSPRRGARSGHGSAARSAGSRWRTSRATGTASASRPRRACRRRSSGRRSGRSTGCSPAMPGRTGRSSAPSPRAAGASRPASSRTRSIAWSPRAPCSRGEFRPGGAEREYCDPEVLRLLRRRSLAKLRREVEPVDPITLARFLPAWQGVAPSASAGSAIPAPLRGPTAPRAAGRGGRPAGRPADPGLGPRARRAPGPRPWLPAAAARRARRDGRGRVGGAGEPRSRRRAGRPVPAGSRAAAADRAARRRRPARRTRSTSGSGRTSAGAAPRSTASCSPRRAGGRTARCSTRCGTSSGPAR